MGTLAGGGRPRRRGASGMASDRGGGRGFSLWTWLPTCTFLEPPGTRGESDVPWPDDRLHAQPLGISRGCWPVHSPPPHTLTSARPPSSGKDLT